MRQIFWDWNGTLLDDVWYCIRIRNTIFPQFGVEPLKDDAQYFREFTFPVIQYYRNAGLKDEQFNEVAHAWMAEYERCFSEISLYPDAAETLQQLQKAGLRQLVLSATKQDMLCRQVNCYPIRDYFDALYGLGDIYAVSKVELGKQCLAKSGIAPEESLMIGDTLHDAEVAEQMGIRCLLICRGHQKTEKLKSAGVPIVNTLSEAAEWILSQTTNT